MADTWFSGRETRKKYEQVAMQVLENIRRDALKEGDRLPSERDMADLFAVSPGTIRRAFRSLEAEGVIRRSEKSGTFFTGTLPEVQSAVDEPAASTDPELGPIPTIFDARRGPLVLYARDLSNPRCKRLWQEVADAYARHSGGSEVRLVTSEAATETAAITETRPDLVLISDSGLRDLAQAEMVTARDELGDVIEAGDFFPLTGPASAWKGRPVGVPVYLSAPVCLYNLSQLPAGSDTDHRMPRDTFELAATVADLEANSGHDVIAVTFLHMILYQLVVDGVLRWFPGAPSLYEFDEREAAEIMAFNRRMYRRTMRFLDAEVDDRAKTYGIWKLFADGRMLCVDTFNYALGRIPDDLPFDIGVRGTSLLAGDMSLCRTSLLAMPITCLDRQRAIGFIRFASGPAGQEILARDGMHVPARMQNALGDYAQRAPEGMDNVLKGLTSATDSVMFQCDLFNQIEREYHILEHTMAYYQGRTHVNDLIQVVRMIVAESLERCRRAS